MVNTGVSLTTFMRSMKAANNGYIYTKNLTPAEHKAALMAKGRGLVVFTEEAVCLPGCTPSFAVYGE